MENLGRPGARCNLLCYKYLEAVRPAPGVWRSSNAPRISVAPPRRCIRAGFFQLVPKLRLGHACPGSSASQVNTFRCAHEAERREGRFPSRSLGTRSALELGNQVKTTFSDASIPDHRFSPPVRFPHPLLLLHRLCPLRPGESFYQERVPIMIHVQMYQISNDLWRSEFGHPGVISLCTPFVMG